MKKKPTLTPSQQQELDRMWPNGQEYLIGERPEGMSFEEYKTRKRHEREMLKFRKKYYGFEPHVKIKKETPNSKGSSQGRKEDQQPEVPFKEQTTDQSGEGTTTKE